jgi:putative ABC transport system substrate-binding protein
VTDVRRREFITLLGGAAAAWPLAAGAQQPAMPVIGYIHPTSPAASANLLAAFHKGLMEAGYVENRNVAIEYRWAGGDYNRLPALSADLVRRQVAVVVTVGGNPVVLAAKAATTTIPIVFATGGDPVKDGIVASLNRPGGNITGVTQLTSELALKQLELLGELVPATEVIGLLANPTNPAAESRLRELQDTARALGRKIVVVNALSESDLHKAFATLVQMRAGAFLIVGDSILLGLRNQIVALAAHHALPAIYSRREFAVAGGLMSYGTNLSDAYRQAGAYAGRILQGAKPADLPVVQSTKVEFVINLKTAKALGLTIPLPLVGRADEVIE